MVQSIRAGSMSVYEDKEGTSNGLSRVSQLTASPALFGLLWLGCLPRIMAGEQNKQGVAQGTRVGMCPATPNKKGVSDAHQSPSSPRHGSPAYICTYFFSPLKVNRVKGRLAL